MPPAKTALRRYLEVEPTAALEAGLDAVFFEASNTKSFVSEAERAAFRERWLGRYLRHDAALAHVAIAADGAVAGYVVGSVEDPAIAERFSDLGYLHAFRDLTRLYPAHLHVNLAPQFRGRGLGGRLVERFIADAAAAGAPGVHVTTSRGARNVAFYERNGFSEQASLDVGMNEVLFLARTLRPPTT